VNNNNNNNNNINNDNGNNDNDNDNDNDNNVIGLTSLKFFTKTLHDHFFTAQNYLQ